MKMINIGLKLKAVLVFLMLLIMVGSCKNNEEIHPPNIVLFLVDDLGWQDTSVPFHTDTTSFNTIYHTPNMERLAAEGMKFTQAYAACVCSPSRVSLMTGMNAARHRVTNWTLHKNKMPDRADDSISIPNWNMNGLNLKEGIENTVTANTLPQLLQNAGYHTIHVGKAHFAAIDTPCSNPLNCGFDVNIAGHAAGAPGSYSGMSNFGNNPDGSPKNNWSVPGLEKYHGQDINLTEALTLEALAAVDKAKQAGDPFYLYMSHYTVHTPIQKDERFYKKYLDKGLDTLEAKYASMIESMDKSLGDILNYLEDNQLTNNTIVLFMSDNGGLSAHARGGTRHKHNAPLRSGKGSAYEGGVREPMLVKWPQKVNPGSVCNQYVIIEDFFPSILDMVNIPNNPYRQLIDGQSFKPLLLQNKTKSDERPIYWHYPNIWGGSGPGIAPYSAIRKGDWKLIYFHRNRTFELYNLSNDIGESSNLVNINAKKKAELAKLLSNYLRSVNAQMPIDKSTGLDIPWPDDIN